MPECSVSNVTKPIGKLLEMVDRGQLVLPEIQRDFVWSRGAIKLLLDSMYQGLPIGHMLVWKARTTVATKSFDRRKLKRGMHLDGFYGYLLDGQQRLTALAHLRDNDEAYPLMFNLWPKRADDNEEPLYWRGKNEEDNPWWMPVSEVLSPDFSPTGRLSLLKADPDFRPEHEEVVREDLARLRRVLEYGVGVTEFEAEDYRLATTLFVRFNSTGKKLRRSDLQIAELANHVPDLAGTEIRRAQSKWKDFRFTMPFLVQCLFAVHSGRLRLKDSRKFWAEVKSVELKASWRETERAIARVVEFLTGTVRWTSAAQVPSFNALIPLIVVLAEGASWSVDDKRLARRWLLLASVHGLFSGHSDTQIDRVLRSIEASPSIQHLWKASQRSLRRLKASDFETSRMSGSVMSLYLSMIRTEQAKDWDDPDSPLDGTVVGHGAALQVHHFFPKALLKRRKEVSERDVNTFANYTVIGATANLNVSTEEPGAYLERLNVPAEELRKQCIPDDQSLWRVGRYSDFLAQRRKLLAERANAFLGV
jgi:hypothetical protein